MNVSVSHNLYIHTVYENYVNVEWIKVTDTNVFFKENTCTHVIPIKKILSFNVTQ